MPPAPRTSVAACVSQTVQAHAPTVAYCRVLQQSQASVPRAKPTCRPMSDQVHQVAARRILSLHSCSCSGARVVVARPRGERPRAALSGAPRRRREAPQANPSGRCGTVQVGGGLGSRCGARTPHLRVALSDALHQLRLRLLHRRTELLIPGRV